jgi:hypothetical protein
MSNLKEQAMKDIKKRIEMRMCNWCSDSRVCVRERPCGYFSEHAQEWVDLIEQWLSDSNYYPLQADDKGLVIKGDVKNIRDRVIKTIEFETQFRESGDIFWNEIITKLREYWGCDYPNDVEQFLLEIIDQTAQDATKAQKALCDKEWREKIEYYKYSYLGGGHYKIIITEEQWEELLSEMGNK